MAKATGYFCDHCKTFDSTEDSQPPIGWLRLTVRTAQHDPNGGFDLCSNKCLTAFARERAKAEKGSRPSQAKRTNTRGAVEDDGTTRIPGNLDKWLRDDPASLRQSWWGAYAQGEQVPIGKGYSWVVEFDEEDAVEFASYLESIVTVIRRTVAAEHRAQTHLEKNILVICNSLAPALLEAAA